MALTSGLRFPGFGFVVVLKEDPVDIATLKSFILEPYNISNDAIEPYAGYVKVVVPYETEQRDVYCLQWWRFSRK